MSVFWMLLILLSLTDTGIAWRVIPDESIVNLQKNCSDKKCDRVSLTITSPVSAAVFKINLKKRFELNTPESSCSFYINRDYMHTPFAGFRCCISSGSKEEVWQGTFFQNLKARSDVAQVGGKYKLRINLYSFDLTGSSRGLHGEEEGPAVDRLLIQNRNIGNQKIPVPQVYEILPDPVIEVVIAFDAPMMVVFNQNEDDALIFAISVINFVDAFYASIGIQVSLAGVRFLPKENFTDFPPALDEKYLEELRSFFYHHLLSGSESEFNTSTSIPGVPDVIMVFTQFYLYDETDGLAFNYDPGSSYRGFGFVKPRQIDPLTGKLSLYKTAATFAHEVGHTLGLEHAAPACSCITENGYCLMWERNEWMIPFWTLCDRKSLSERQEDGRLAYLKQKNVRSLQDSTVTRNAPGTSTQQVPDKISKQKDNRTVLIVGIIVGVVLLLTLAGAAVVWFRRSRKTTVSTVSHETTRRRKQPSQMSITKRNSDGKSHKTRAASMRL